MAQWMKGLVAVLAVAALPACTVALHGEQSSGGTVATMTSSSVSAGASGANYAVRAGFGSPVPLGAPGGHLVVSNAGVAAALILGVVVVNALDYLSGAPVARTPPGVGANRAIAHTCSCYGYRPDEEAQPARE